ncbi:hypothetical protein ACFL54_05505 [Planctomycetota bacterium]
MNEQPETPAKDSIDAYWIVVSIGLLLLLLIGGVLIFIPERSETNKYTRQRTARETLKQLHTAQAIFQEKVSKDMDTDNFGEYAADFEELTGDNANGKLAMHAVGVSQINMIPNATDPTISEKNGYCFKLFIPSVDGTGNTNEDESAWCVIAWPKINVDTGAFCCAVNEAGVIYRLNNDAGFFEGIHAAPTIDSLYKIPFQNDTIPGEDEWAED